MSRSALLTAVLLALALCLPAPAPAAPRFRPVADDVFYMFMPIAWRDSDNDANRFGDFDGMTASLPYLESLGVTAVWMTPIFPSAAYHGYQHGAADALSPRFGAEASFWAFVRAAHERGIKVCLDFVAYGISENSVWFQSAHGQPNSPYDSWLAFTNAANTQYLGCCPYTTWDGSSVGFIFWDLRTAPVRQLVTDWALHWVDPDGNGDPSDGIDGFRLDHVSHGDATESAFGYDLPFWSEWAAALRARNPDIFLFAEQADWGSYGDDLLGPLDAAFTKPFESAARWGLAHSDARPLAGVMANTVARLPADRLFLTTLGNHDIDRLTTALGDDPGRLRAAAAALLLQPLPPVLYFGDELGMRGAKRYDYPGDASDLPNREPFKWNAVAGPPMSNYYALNAPAYAGRLERDHDGRSVEEESGVAGSLLETYRTLGALRQARPALRHGAYRTVATPDTTLWAFTRSAPEETLLVVVHLATGALTAAALDLSSYEPGATGRPVEDAVTGASLEPLALANRAAYPLAVPAWGYRVLRLHAGRRDIRSHWAGANRVLTQDCPSLFGDNQFELDQLFARFDPAGLALGLTGNLAQGGNSLMLLFDAAPGGQSTLRTATLPSLPSTLPNLDGLTLDAGFVPETALAVNLYGGQVYVDLYTLASGGGGSKRYLGTTPVDSGAPLAGGINTNGARVAYFSSNSDGVTPASVAGAATATDGFELLVPWADLGLAGPGPALKLLAFIAGPDGYLVNQFLPPLGGVGTPLGYAPFNLGSVAGAQYVTFDATTGIAATLVSATLTPEGASVFWQVGESAGATFLAERRVDDGAWTRIDALRPDGAGRVRLLDPAPPPGARLTYRLLALDRTGTHALGEAELLVPPNAGPRLALLGANPAAGAPTVRFWLSGQAPARLELLDVAGRRVVDEALGTPGAGPFERTLRPAGRLAGGVYFVRLTEAGRSSRMRVLVLR